MKFKKIVSALALSLLFISGIGMVAQAEITSGGESNGITGFVDNPNDRPKPKPPEISQEEVKDLSKSLIKNNGEDTPSNPSLPKLPNTGDKGVSFIYIELAMTGFIGTLVMLHRLRKSM